MCSLLPISPDHELTLEELEVLPSEWRDYALELDMDEEDDV